MVITILTPRVVAQAPTIEPKLQANESQSGVAKSLTSAQNNFKGLVAEAGQHIKVRKKEYPAGVCVEAMKQHFPESDWKIAYAIMKSESGARPDAVGGPNKNGTYDYGCFQINNEPSALDPYVNARRAFEKRSSKLGWGHWSDYKNGKYLRYL